MAYGEIYKHEYCDYFGNNSKISILKNGYSGTVKSVDAGPSPIVFDYEGDDSDKFDPIKASTANITLVGNDSFNMEELYTADEREYMVEHFIGSNLNWRGYIIPNGFSQDWTSGSFYMSLVASDNLSTLKDFKFLNDNGTVIKGRLKHTDVLLKCLNKLDINIELLTLTSIVREDGASGEDPLYINTTDAYTFLDTFVEEEGLDFYFDNPDNAFDCYTVVQSICSLYGAKLYQNKGAWRFKRINVDYGPSITGQAFHRYSTTGAKLGTIAYNENIVLPCNSTVERQQLDGATIAMSDVYKSASVRYEYRYKQIGDILPKIINNQELDGLNKPPLEFVPYDWTVGLRPGVNPPFTRSLKITPSSDFPPLQIGGALSISDSVRDALKSTKLQDLKQGDRININLWTKRSLEKLYINSQGSYFERRVNLLVIIKFFSPGKGWWVLGNNNSKFTDEQNEINLQVGHWQRMPTGDSVGKEAAFSIGRVNYSVTGGSEVIAWESFNILSDGLPEDGYIEISFIGSGAFKVGESSLGFPTSSNKALAFAEPLEIGGGGQETFQLYSTEYKIGSLQIGRLIGSGSSGRIYTAEQSKKYTKRPDVINLLTSDVENENTIGDVLTLGSFVDKWQDARYPYNGYRPLGALGAMDVMRQYKEVWRVVEEDIVVAGINIDTTFVFEERPNERYLIQRGSFDHKECKLVGATLIQASQNPVIPFDGSETVEEDLRTEKGGTSGGGSGGSSGGGSAPQDLQSVTDIGAESTNIITVKGTRNTDLLSVPASEPNPADIKPDERYFWIGSGGGTPIPPPVMGNLEDLQNVQNVIANGKYLQKVAGVWTGVDIPIPDLSSYATQSWVNIGFVPQSRTINGKSLTANINLTAADVGALTQSTADGRYVTLGTKQSITGEKQFKGNLGVPTSEPVSPETGVRYFWIGDGGTAEVPPIAGYLSDLQDVSISGLVNGQYLQWNGSKWVNSTIPFPDLSSYATQSWVNGKLADYVPTLRKVNGKALTADITLTATDVGALSQATADGRYVTLATKQTITGEKQFTGNLGVPVAEPVSPQAGVSYFWIGSGGSGGVTPPPILGDLEDLQNVQNVIANGKYLQKIAGIWTGVDIPIPDLTGYALQSWVTAGFSPLGHTHTFASLTNKPTTLSGYGITDSYTRAQMDTRYKLTFTENTAFNKNFGTASGTVAQGNDSRINNGQTAYGWGDFRDYGLGKNVTVDQSDLNNYGETGFYRFNNTELNRPFSYGTLYHARRSETEMTQLVIPVQASVSGMAWRGQTGQSPWDWRTIWDNNNHVHRSDAQNDSRYVLKAGDTMSGYFAIIPTSSPTISANMIQFGYTSQGTYAQGNDANNVSAWVLRGYVGSGNFQASFNLGDISVLGNMVYHAGNLRNDTQNDARYVLKAGDRITGALTVTPSDAGANLANSINIRKHSAVDQPYIGGRDGTNTETFVLSSYAFLTNFQMRLSLGGLQALSGVIQAPTLEATQNLIVPTAPPVSPQAGKTYFWIS